ncbi:acetyl-CoA synthetase-like protein [Gonapodya prolifera JEL478]|uniref:Acetyl-CoA synthetase-like protein n=1 Tax=Gonapodya prolifera (strain JEL478) TaxID=1344416 RepID=A0A139AP40_GONPJ|nr:acetyl-CoA synthetase-like protein [Gonapodya prolifera JEL478]|eukprot:KXS18519.1 acetyl-CoA synthetase-like protein [Gonapodya prolifera JEL478]
MSRLALGAVSAIAAAALVNEELGLSRDWSSISAQKKAAQIAAAESAAGRFSNVERFILHAKNKPDEEYLVFQNSPGAGDTVDSDGFPNTRRYTWRETDLESNRLANFMLDTGIKPGDMIAILYENTPEFVFLLLAAWKIGCSVAFQNYNQRGRVFLHSFSISKSQVLFFEPAVANILNEDGVADELRNRGIRLVCYTNVPIPLPGKQIPFDFPAELVPSHELRFKASDADIPKSTRSHVTWSSIGSLIYTSGTTGLPKAATMTHARMFSGQLRFQLQGLINSTDRGFVVAPLFHSGANIILQSTFIVGIPFICTRKFSASKFFEYAAQTGGTTFHYVGEILRYLVLSPPSPYDRKHNVRKCVGNGLRADIWDTFRDRFGIKLIGELYGSTEGCGNAATLNVWGKKGAIGFQGLAYRIMNAETLPQIVKINPITEEFVRGPDGFCIPCGINEPGEFVGKVVPLPARIKETNWDGYYGNPEASNKKVIRDVFKKGDQWIRTGDLIMRDRKGWIYFVDRLGDTFRWKGENVSTMEVRDVMMKSGYLDEANVYGVTVPSRPDGRAGMAAVVLKEEFRYDFNGTLKKLGQFCQRELPPYAVPRFVRLLENMDAVTTATFKHRKIELQKEGFDPKQVSDKLFFYVENKGFVTMTGAIYNEVVGGKAKL